jgi:hypothetical protein
MPNALGELRLRHIKVAHFPDAATHLMWAAQRLGLTSSLPHLLARLPGRAGSAQSVRMLNRPYRRASQAACQLQRLPVDAVD